jgi:hypothetical protein
MNPNRAAVLIMAALIVAACASWAQEGGGLSLEDYKKLLDQALDQVSEVTPSAA